ncbi:MAG: proline--tRNA ligase [Candidatus Omnitrophota bacterium]|jgi:prolyl-tRNA synthetase
MLWSKAFIPTLKETPQEAESIGHQLMLRAGLMRPLISGVYSYLPLGYRVLQKIENIIRQEMNSCGAQELLLSALQPEDIWLKSGRDKEMAQVMIRFKDRRGRKLCLGPTHEEVITDLVSQNVSSYRQLPIILYQIQVKFRDEIRPRFGLVRSCEFIMKDAYSFDKDQAGLKQSYDKMFQAYQRIFKRCGLSFLIVEADPGVMGGSLSHEFMVPAESGEDIIMHCSDCKFSISKIEQSAICPKCKKALHTKNTIEVGHVFQLGTKYSKTFQANFLNPQGSQSPIIMGCYGIGVSRLIPAVLQQNHDQQGIIWPWEVAPFSIIILPLEVGEGKIYQAALNIYNELTEKGLAVLLDDRDERAGVKFKDADLIGIPLQVILGEKFLKQGMIELKIRSSGKRIVLDTKKLSQEIGKYSSGLSRG